MSLASARIKRVLLINAVVWSPPEVGNGPLAQVDHWYARWIKDLPGIELLARPPVSDLLATVNSDLAGVILSGSPRDAWSDDPINTLLCEVILACRDREVPFLGVCYGHQLLGRALGGRVAPHSQGLELGNTDVELTDEGRRSALFQGFPSRFSVLSSHADEVVQLPEGGELLVRGDFSLNQGFHCENRLFGVQFHPETDPEVLRFIWSTRLEKWRQRVSFSLEDRLAGLQATPMAGNVLRNFVTQIMI
jgi:GMP synthase (glutamine-hydrolysing)